MILNLVSHCVMRVESDSRKKRDVLRPQETQLPAEDQGRPEFRLQIITEVQIIIIITIILIMLHRHLGFTTNSKIRRKFLITRRRITNILSLMTWETMIITWQPTRSCLGGLMSPIEPAALCTILRGSEWSLALDTFLTRKKKVSLDQIIYFIFFT